MSGGSLLQAEKEVSASMVHQLMSHLSKARMEKMTVLKGGESMSLQEQHAHLQQLLMSAKQHSSQVCVSLCVRVCLCVCLCVCVCLCACARKK